MHPSRRCVAGAGPGLRARRRRRYASAATARTGMIWPRPTVPDARRHEPSSVLAALESQVMEEANRDRRRG